MHSVHALELDGAAKCGANVYYRHTWDEVTGKTTSKERHVTQKFLYFENKEKGIIADCRRCLNTIARAETLVIVGDFTGKIFHRSFGYDMTINVYVKVIGTTPKGLLVQECKVNYSGDVYGPGGSGKAMATGELKEDAKPFVMLRKLSGHYTKYEYWTGGGNHWNEWDGKPDYENHCD